MTEDIRMGWLLDVEELEDGRLKLVGVRPDPSVEYTQWHLANLLTDGQGVTGRRSGAVSTRPPRVQHSPGPLHSIAHIIEEGR